MKKGRVNLRQWRVSNAFYKVLQRPHIPIAISVSSGKAFEYSVSPLCLPIHPSRYSRIMSGTSEKKLVFRNVVGLEYSLSGLTGNTLDSHRLIYFAGQQEGPEEFLKDPNNGLKEVEEEINTISGNISGVPYYVVGVYSVEIPRNAYAGFSRERIIISPQSLLAVKVGYHNNFSIRA
ncbi:unnamed protein product [Sphenostylis stenocarpa]|uniref:Uncharacterized protein n=1 Tax=Sphenostylis stenocarpa TaxID=92480 RepID=A0AA86RUU4_9FABA|nr:unnamed protein product [Sphenostylis stenocarpa]